MTQRENENIENKIFDKMKQDRDATNLSENFESDFFNKLNKNRNKNYFSIPKLSFAFAILIVIVFSIFYLVQSEQDPIMNKPQIADQKDSVISEKDTLLVKTDKDSSTPPKLEENRLADNFNHVNFEDNPILSGYYGNMRGDVNCKIFSPKLGSTIEYISENTEIKFRGQVISNSTESSQLIIKLYIGSNQNPLFNKKIFTDKQNMFSFSENLKLPGQYSWKIILGDEIIFAGNFFLGKPPAN